MPAPAPAELAAEFLACLRFYTRIPLAPLAAEAAHPPVPFSRCLRWAPLAGGAVGACGAAAVLAAATLGLPAPVGAVLALCATVLAGGGLHEDGLADCADGFGGGRTRERKLEIMRDSRIGSFGALAIGLSLLVRAAALAELSGRGGPPLAAAALAAAAGASRGFGLLPLALLDPVRADGLGTGAGRLAARTFAIAAALSVALGVALPAAAGAGAGSVCAALALAGAAAGWTVRLARRQVGGFTGDVAGACQQLCEIGFLIGLLAKLGPR